MIIFYHPITLLFIQHHFMSITTNIHNLNIHSIHVRSSFLVHEFSTFNVFIHPSTWPKIIPQRSKYYFPSRYDHISSKHSPLYLEIKNSQNPIFRSYWLVTFWQEWSMQISKDHKFLISKVFKFHFQLNVLNNFVSRSKT